MQRSLRDRAPAHQVVVTAVETLTPNMRRITLEGSSLAGMNVDLPAKWLKVILRDSEGRPNRAYTIRRFDPARCAMDIDFVLHGDMGPASAWARRASIGDAIELGEPRGGFRLDGGAKWRLLAGDETALPAIASILEARTPGDGTPTFVFVEVPTAADIQPFRLDAATEIRWLPRDNSHATGSALVASVSAAALPFAHGQIFLAGETKAIRTMKDDLARRVPQSEIDAKGYWRLGCADHRDAP